MSLFAHIEMAPADPIIDTARAFKEDPDAKKVNLGIGAYRTEEGKPYVLPVIRKVEEEILGETGITINKEYAAIDGKAELKELTQKVYFGNASSRIASAQGLSGTGSLRVVAEFIKKHLPPVSHTIYLSKPTWGNHRAIFASSGFNVEEYPYWDAATKGLDFDGMIGKLNTVPDGSSVLLHACAHNPTGVDPTKEQWQKILAVCKEKKLLPILDNAYQGYASGSLENDGYSAKLLFDDGIEFFACQSFAKNMGLYGERIGMLHVICAAEAQATVTLSQLKLIIRAMYSSPPIHGALLVEKLLSNSCHFDQWKKELKEMADRILEVRLLLRKGLEEKKTPGTWKHITDQIGMFSFTGLTVSQCEKLTNTYHVYLLKSGRISLAGLNKGNMDYFVNAVDDVVRTA